MKKLFALAFTIFMILSMTACGSSAGGNEVAFSEEASAGQNGGKVLAAYFTHEGNNVFDGDLSDVDAITSASVQRNGDSFPPQVIDGVHKGNTQIFPEKQS